jgi:hypothetical protein
MRSETIRCLERVEFALDSAHLARTCQLWADCRHYRPISHLPVVMHAPVPDWPPYSMDEIQSDMEKMLVSELAPVYASALIGDDRLPEIRANYGTGILPSLFGCEIFEMMYADPELVHAFLDLVTETLAAFTRAHAAIDGVPFNPPPTPLGRVCIREDATVMISGAMYDEFCKPYAQRLLDEFGGCIHWCGDGKAWWRSLITLRRLNAVNPFQGQFYDPAEMHRACRDAGVMVWQWTTGLTAEQRAGIPTGFTLIQWVDDVAAGKRLMETTR